MSIAISQSLRNDYYIQNWDSPLRMFLCIPIYLAISKGWFSEKTDYTISQRWLDWTIPGSIFLTLICRIYFPSTTWVDHKTTYFVDPLTFCNYTLLFAYLIIINLTYKINEIKLSIKIFFTVSFILSIYLSATSGARTGWLSLPIFLVIWWFILKKKFNLFTFLLLSPLEIFFLSSKY